MGYRSDETRTTRQIQAGKRCALGCSYCGCMNFLFHDDVIYRRNPVDGYFAGMVAAVVAQSIRLELLNVRTE